LHTFKHIILEKEFLYSNTVGSDPVDEARDLSVDTGIASDSAAISPRDDSVLNSVSASASEKRATAVTLAGIDATIGDVSSAKHGVGIDVQVTVGSFAVSNRNDREIDLKKFTRDGTSIASSTPSGNCSDGASGRVEASGRQIDRGNPFIEGQRLIQEDQGDVVVISDGSVVLVHGVRDDISVLFISGNGVKIVLAGNHSELVNIGTADTVSSVQNCFWAEDRTTA